MEKIDYNQRAEILAKELLGKKLCYGGKEYMITVTEAYPFDEKDGKGNIKPISYVNRSNEHKGHDELNGHEKIGNCFVFAGMLHIACKGGNSLLWKNEYSCDNVLIRGGILIENGKTVKENRRLNYKIGSPYTLCRNKLEIIDNDLSANLITDDTIQIKDYKRFSNDLVEECERYNLGDSNKYRYYLKEEAVFEQ